MADLHQKLLEDLRLRGLSASTSTVYLNCINRFGRFFDASPDTLGADEVRRFLLHLEATGRAPGTRAVYHAALTFLFAQTLGKPEIMAPTPRARVRTQRPGRSLTRDEARRFLGALTHRPFDYTFFALILATGLRLSEAVAVCVQDIDRSAGLLHVRQGKGEKPRSVMLSPRTLRLLERYWRVVGPPGPHLFPARERLGTKKKPRSWVPHPVSKWTMSKRLRRLRVPGLERIRSHDLRRTFATWLLEETGDLRLVQVLLGHTSPRPPRATRWSVPIASLIRCRRSTGCSLHARARPMAGSTAASPTVLDALRRHADGFRQRHACDPVRLRVLDRLLACRTGALGGHVLVCDDCGLRTPVYKSCDDRHCPQCGGAKAGEWFEARAARMLSVPHFQVVLTLPSELRAVAHRNPDVVYPLMARTGASVLADLAAQRLGARLGITAVLHTWASNLTLHPHWHLLVTAGGLALDGQRWVPTQTHFLFPVPILAKMYRGRLLEGLIDAFERGELDLGGRVVDFERTLRLVARRHRQWGVHVEAPGDRPVGPALKYLARYVYRVAISDHRVFAVTETGVGFWARDRDSDGKQRQLWLDGPQFVHRFLLHILPKGLRKVRHYGLYAPGSAAMLLEQARTRLPEPSPDGIPSDLEADGFVNPQWPHPDLLKWPHPGHG